MIIIKLINIDIKFTPEFPRKSLLFKLKNNKINNTKSIKKTNKMSLLIDNTSLELIKGSKIDYVKELIGSSFKITNPQASSSCGCGTSFSL